MLSLIALALAAAAPPAPSAPSTPSPALEASAPWWEKITVTVDDKGSEQSCKYESSLAPEGPEACDGRASAPSKARAQGGPAAFSKLTFERRFSPGPRPDSGRLEVGDKLLAQQVLYLTIDSAGSVQACRVVATSGDALPDYGCDEAKSERFRARASSTPESTRQAFMTVLVYGHTEQLA